MATAEPKPLINLLRGWPAPATLPVAQLQEATAALLSGTGVGSGPTTLIDSLQYGPDPGFLPLREEVAHYLDGVFGDFVPSDAPAASGAPPIGVDRICITGGASQSAACILQSFTDPSYTACVWVSAPCYYLMCPIFEDGGFAGRLRAVPEDGEGINLELLEAGFRSCGPAAAAPKYKTHLPTARKAYRHVVYVVPASSNPSGRTMSLARREQLVRLARRYDALVVADDVYDFLQWHVEGQGGANGHSANGTNGHSNGNGHANGNGHTSGIPLPTPLPRLVDIDRMLPHDGTLSESSRAFGHAISNGSFSKIVAPGMRTGWVEGTPDFANGLAQTGSNMSGGAPSQFSAATIAEMMRSGAMDRHLRETVRPALRRRHQLLADAVERHLGAFVEIESVPTVPTVTKSPETATATFGGYFLWCRLRRADMSATEVAARARKMENLIVPPGPSFAVKGDEATALFDDHFRLSFAWEDEDRLVEGVQRLARVLANWDEPVEEGSDGDMGDYK